MLQLLYHFECLRCKSTSVWLWEIYEKMERPHFLLVIVVFKNIYFPKQNSKPQFLSFFEITSRLELIQVNIDKTDGLVVE